MPSGKKGALECVAPLESLVTLAVTDVVPPGPIVPREAAMLSTSQGLVFTLPLPDVVSLPVVFGPVLLPHQFSGASAGVVVVLSTPTKLPTIRLKLAVASAIVVAPVSASTLIPAPGKDSPPLPLLKILLLRRVPCELAVLPM